VNNLLTMPFNNPLQLSWLLSFALLIGYAGNAHASLRQASDLSVILPKRFGQ